MRKQSLVGPIRFPCPVILQRSALVGRYPYLAGLIACWAECYPEAFVSLGPDEGGVMLSVFYRGVGVMRRWPFTEPGQVIGVESVLDEMLASLKATDRPPTHTLDDLLAIMTLADLMDRGLIEPPPSGVIVDA